MAPTDRPGSPDCSEASDLKAVKTYAGQDRAWELLGDMDPEDVCRKADVSFDGASGLFTVRSFGADFRVSLPKREIVASSMQGSLLLNTPEYFFGLSILWYLASAKDIPLSGRLMKPVHIKGGQIFFRGTHVLPLDSLAEKYSRDREGFLRRGKEFGGEVTDYGDASVRISAFPRVPVFIMLWMGDDEFPPRADLMFDSTCDLQLPTDVIWSIATMSVLVML